MAVTGGAAVWSLAAGLRLERLDVGGKAVSRVAEDGKRPSGSGQICRRPAVSGTKKENVFRRSLFLCVQAGRGRHSFPGEAPAVADACDFWRCAALFPAVRQRRGPASRPEKSFFRVGESARGGGTVFTKNVPPPLVQNSVAETIRRRRRSRRRRRDWRRFRQGGPDGRLPACAGGCPGGGCIRSRRCAPDGGRR